MPGENNPRKIKVISMGDEDTGKSCLIKRFCEKRFVSKYSPTIGIDYGVFRTKVSNTDLRVDIFDMSGNPAFYDVRNEFYKDVDGAILVFDVTKRTSFGNLIRWVQELHFELGGLKSTSFPVIIVCGNKVDKLPRSISYYDASEWAAKHQYPYFETSAFSGHGVLDTFNTLFESIINPDVYQSNIPTDKYQNCSTRTESNHTRQYSTQNTSKFNQPLNERIQTSVKGFPSPSTSSLSNKSSENESFKVKHLHIHEINRIKNAKNDYERLGVSITANSDDIQRAFRRLAFILHPDKNDASGSEEAFKILVKAKNTLLSTKNGSSWFSS
uniref:J domain-containing protein n=1 Tax=Trichobilharzia regenti TaxID=157069 RepID=A0AA85J632_TRIRE|nr:unnamed protein product [Trichobilharzia regenti]